VKRARGKKARSGVHKKVLLIVKDMTLMWTWFCWKHMYCWKDKWLFILTFYSTPLIRKA